MVGLICTRALVSRQDICQEQLGGGWRRGGSCSGSPIASGPSWACSGARSLSHFTAQWGCQTWHCYEPWGHPLPCCSPFFVQSFLLFALSVPQSISPSFFASYLLLPLPLFLGYPFSAGRASRLGTEHFCVATAI